jgi:hypothetical protein
MKIFNKLKWTERLAIIVIVALISIPISSIGVPFDFQSFLLINIGHVIYQIFDAIGYYVTHRYKLKK